MARYKIRRRPVTVNFDTTLPKAAKQLRMEMERLHASIVSTSEVLALFMALSDNDRKVETLASVASDQGFQLIGQLDAAYNDLASFLATEFTQE